MKRITTIFAAILMTASAFAQAPQKMSYQAVVRNSSDALITSTSVGMRISILQGAANGTAVYVETQTPTTNTNGLVSLEIGAGTLVSGDFSTIDWANGPYFIRTETDPNGGANYTISGASELLSVPYALFSANGTPGPQGAQGPQGPSGGNGSNGSNGTNGLDGNGIASTTDNGDGTFTFTYDDGSTFTTSDLTGPQGATGARGPQGAQGLQGIQGPQGPAGANGTNGTNGLDGNGITSTIDNGDGTFTFTYDDGSTFTTSDLTGPSGSSLNNFYLGQDTLGGIVFYIYLDANGSQRGLIVNKNESTARWQNVATTTNASRSWDGVYNTNLMTNSPAVNYVNALTDGGFSDWYLPSIDELSILWHNRFHANNALNSGGFTLLSNTTYWSSTEYGGSIAFRFSFSEGYRIPDNPQKTGIWSVRAIRAF